MTFEEAYTSLKQLYKSMMFPTKEHAPKWTLADIDQLDVHFFNELMSVEDIQPQEKDVYLSDIW